MRDVPGLVYSDVDVASGASLAGLDDVFSDDEDFALADDSTIKVDVVCRYPIGRIPHEVHICVYMYVGGLVGLQHYMHTCIYMYGAWLYVMASITNKN